MSKSKITPLEVVERYHTRYLQYEEAFEKNPFNEKILEEDLKEMIKSGMDIESEEFSNKMVEVAMEKPQRRVDVSKAAKKFILFAEFYMLTQEEELPKNIIKDYEALPVKEELKMFYSIENGNFVKNEDKEVSEQTKQYLKDNFKQMMQQE